MNVLGINGFWAHAASCLVQDGALTFALEDERLTRVKGGGLLSPYRDVVPFASIFAALRTQKMRAQDLDVVAFSHAPWQQLRAVAKAALCRPGFTWRIEKPSAFASLRAFEAFRAGLDVPEAWREIWDPAAMARVKIRSFDHALCHAASAFYYSGFDEALVLVADTRGEVAATSVYAGREKKLRLIAQINWPDSLGLFVGAVTHHLGFVPGRDEYKVMGMAAYGEDGLAGTMAQVLRGGTTGRYALDSGMIGNLASLFGPPRRAGDPLLPRHYAIAKAAQTCLEDVVLALARFYAGQTGQKRLCVAGDVFHNILLNVRLAEQVGADSFFVQPAAHDAGTALGAAALASGGVAVTWKSLFLGTAHEDWEIEALLKQAGFPYERISKETMPSVIASLLSNEQSVALFRGRMEFGPRALGHRSLLALPASPRMRERLNRAKGRESFRPLAPLVTEEAFDTFFEGPRSRFMTFAARAKDSAKQAAPAIVHADGTARVQVVRRADDPFLHEILVQVAHKGHPPLLINTSLNVRGHPIDESPEEALASFATAGIDALAIGSFLVKRS